MILTRYIGAMALACVLACGGECPAGTMMGVATCKVPDEPKAGSVAGAGGHVAKPWPRFEDGGKGGSGGSGAAGRTPDIGIFHDAGAGSYSDADSGPQMSVEPSGPHCGNGVVEPGEECDGASCPLSCDTGNACVVGSITGSRLDCSAKCVQKQVAECKDDDGCCAQGCGFKNDNDCSATCGNGTVEDLELCDGDCPAACDDKDACTVDKLNGSAATCNAACMHTKITQPKAGDDCCPPGANATNDSDCKPVCGNGVVETGETCDGKCPSCDDKNPCTVDTATGSVGMCDLKCAHANAPVGSNCGGSSRCDNNGACKAPACGDGVVDSGEVCDGNCPTVCPASTAPCSPNVLTGSADTCTAKCAVTPAEVGTVCGTGQFAARGACQAGGDCQYNNWYTPCAIESGCAGSLHCLDYQCTVMCDRDDQCGAPAIGERGRCVDHICERRCASDAQCADGQICLSPPEGGVCRPKRCNSTADCPDNMLCTRVGGGGGVLVCLAND